MEKIDPENMGEKKIGANTDANVSGGGTEGFGLHFHMFMFSQNRGFTFYSFSNDFLAVVGIPTA